MVGFEVFGTHRISARETSQFNQGEGYMLRHARGAAKKVG
jgi:hypothetical protein